MELIKPCRICNAISTGETTNIFSEDEANSFFEDIYKGKITKRNLSPAMYEKIANHLTNGVYEGYGKALSQVKYNSPDFAMLSSLRENVYIFSAAKTYQQTKEISSLLYSGEKIKPFNEFKKDASKVFDDYNASYLKAEYNSAIHQSRSASLWQQIEEDKSVYNQLQYHTVGDARVRDEHKILDGIIRPVNDKFWGTFYPPNGWNCRCTVLQVSGKENTNLNTRQRPSKEDVPEIFRFNAGQDKIIFSPKHPYFEVAKEDKSLAKRNFNLPLPTSKDAKQQR